MSKGGEGAEIETHRFIMLQEAIMLEVLGECPNINVKQLKDLVDESGKMSTYNITWSVLFFREGEREREREREHSMHME